MLSSHDRDQPDLQFDHIPSQAILKEKDENREDGDDWWTIALPIELHRRSLTFGQTAEQQSLSSDEGIHPFVSNVRHYLRILERRDVDDYFQALSAFRYMYRCQTKEHIPIDGKNLIGSTPRLSFFSDKMHLKQLDQLFTRRLQHFMQLHY